MHNETHRTQWRMREYLTELNYTKIDNANSMVEEGLNFYKVLTEMHLSQVRSTDQQHLVNQELRCMSQ
jgi:hypothetical protein